MVSIANHLALGPAPSGYEKARDKSVYWTLSLHVSRAAVRGLLGRNIHPDEVHRIAPHYLDSIRLSNAMEPLFNDIADREHLGKVDDTLLDTPGPVQGEIIEIQTANEVSWTTEGKRFRSTPPGLGKPRKLRLRRFWYAHKNGTYSYHLSFRYDYTHDPAEFYFLSLLQKVAAPKEFSANALPQGKSTWFADEPGSGVYPLEKIFVSDAAQKNVLFWKFVAERFESDARDLFSFIATSVSATAFKIHDVRFRTCVTHAPFIEVPGLTMPLARFMFMFQDATLFDRLLPPPDSDTGNRPALSQMVQSDCYVPYLKKIEASLADEAIENETEIRLGESFWEWVKVRPEYAGLSQEEVDEIRKRTPAFEKGRSDCLHYLFLSGFMQNIIDFMNQDTSEVLDSIDPIYPTNEIQADESFLVRFANPRALITFVKTSRSLETGNDYIGTCPYAFLIHVASIHNEFLTREYEVTAFNLVDTVKNYNQKKKLKKATEAFYRFRINTYAEYKVFRYSNIFRYDTERDVFREIEKLRGTARKEAFLDELVQNLESQTRDLEARLAKSDEQSISWLLGAVGVFGFFQLVFNWSDKLQQFSQRPDGPAVFYNFIPPFVHIEFNQAPTGADALSLFALYSSFGFTALMVFAMVYIVYRRLRR